MALFFGSGRQILDSADWTITVNSNAGNLSAKTYYFSLQAGNRSGCNKNLGSGLISVSANSSLTIRINASAVKSGEYWDRFIIGIKYKLDDLYQELATIQYKDPENPKLNLPLPSSITFTTDDQLIPGLIVDEFPTTGLYNGRAIRHTTSGYIYRYQQYSNIPESVPPYIEVDSGNVWISTGSLTNNIEDTTGVNGCDIDINYVDNYSEFDIPVYEGDGNESEEVVYFLTNESATQYTAKGTVIDCYVFLNEDEKPTNLLKDKLILEPLGFVNLLTGELRTDDGAITFKQTGREIFLGTEEIFLEDDLQANEAYAIKVSLNFVKKDLAFLDGVPIRIDLDFSNFSASYLNSGGMFGEGVILAEKDFRRIVPGQGLNAIALEGSGVVNDYKFENVKPSNITNLAVNTSNQKLIINRVGDVYFEPMNTIETNSVLRASVGTLEGESHLTSKYSINVTTSGQMLRISVDYPTVNTSGTVYGVIRGDYPDVIAGNNKAYFNPTTVRIYIDNGTQIRYWDKAITPISESEAFYIEDFNTGTLVGSIPNNPKFGLYNPPTILLNHQVGGILPIDTYDVYISYIYTGEEITDISHTNPVISGGNTYTPIKELKSEGLVNIINDYNYYRQPYTLPELEALDVSTIQDGTEFKFKHNDGIFPVVLEKTNTETVDNFRVIQAQEGRFKNKSVPVGTAEGDLIIGTYPDNLDLVDKSITEQIYNAGYTQIDMDRRGLVKAITQTLPNIPEGIHSSTSSIVLDSNRNISSIIPRHIGSYIDNENIQIPVFVYMYVETSSGSSNFPTLEVLINGKAESIATPSNTAFRIYGGYTTRSGINTIEIKVNSNISPFPGYIAILGACIGDNVILPNTLGTLPETSISEATVVNFPVELSATTPRGTSLGVHYKAINKGHFLVQGYIPQPSNTYLPENVSPADYNIFANISITNTGTISDSVKMTQVQYGWGINTEVPTTPTQYLIVNSNSKFEQVEYLIFRGVTTGTNISITNITKNNKLVNNAKDFVTFEQIYPVHRNYEIENGALQVYSTVNLTNTVPIVVFKITSLNYKSDGAAIPTETNIVRELYDPQVDPSSFYYSDKGLLRSVQANNLPIYLKFIKDLSIPREVPVIDAEVINKFITTNTNLQSVTLKGYAKWLSYDSTQNLRVYILVDGVEYSILTGAASELTYFSHSIQLSEGIHTLSIVAECRATTTNRFQIYGLTLGENIFTNRNAVNTGIKTLIKYSGNYESPTLGVYEYIYDSFVFNYSKHPTNSGTKRSYSTFIDYRTNITNTHNLSIELNGTNILSNYTSTSGTWQTIQDTSNIKDGWNYLLIRTFRNSSAVTVSNLIEISNFSVNNVTYDLSTGLERLGESDNNIFVSTATLKSGSNGQVIKDTNGINTSGVAIYRFYVTPVHNALYLPETTSIATGDNIAAIYNVNNEVYLRKESNAIPAKILTENSLLDNALLNNKPGAITIETNDSSKLKLSYRFHSPNYTATTKLIINGTHLTSFGHNNNITYDQEFNLKPGINSIYIEVSTYSNAVLGDNTFHLYGFDVDGSYIKLDQLYNYSSVTTSKFTWDGTTNSLKSDSLNANEVAYLYFQVDASGKILQNSRNIYYRDSEKNSQLLFYYKVNSTDSNNQFRFYVDDVQQFSNYNVVNWTLYNNTVRPGIRKLRFEFDKRVTEADVYAEISSLCIGNHDWFDTNMPSMTSTTPGFIVPSNNQWNYTYGALHTGNSFYYYRSDQYVTRYNKSVFELIIHVPYHAEGGYRYYSTIPLNNQLHINPVANQVHRINVDRNVTINIRDYSTPKEGDICYIYCYLNSNATVTFNPWSFDIGTRKILNTIYSQFIATFVYVNGIYRLSSLEQEDYTSFWSITNESYENKPVYVREGTFNVPNNGSTSVTWHSISGLDKAVRCDAFMRNGGGTHKYVQSVEVNTSEIRFTDSRDNSGYAGHYRLYFTVT